MRYAILGVVMLLTSGCVGNAIRASKGQSPNYYSKPGATWESRDADWQACGGRGTASRLFWDPVWEDVSKVRACMIDKGYSQSMTAGDADGTPTKPTR